MFPRGFLAVSRSPVLPPSGRYWQTSSHGSKARDDHYLATVSDEKRSALESLRETAATRGSDHEGAIDPRLRGDVEL
jgi:hypothetical protein